MTISDVVQLTAVILASFTSIASIVIVVLTLLQNKKMIEESTRPIISVYTQRTNFQTVNQYVVIKNCGNSSAYIESFESNRPISEYLPIENPYRPFEHLAGTTIAPQQSYLTVIDGKKVNEDNKNLTITIKYASNVKKYDETTVIRLDAYSGSFSHRASTDGKELKIISYALQEIGERLL